MERVSGDDRRAQERVSDVHACAVAAAPPAPPVAPFIYAVCVDEDGRRTQGESIKTAFLFHDLLVLMFPWKPIVRCVFK